MYEDTSVSTFSNSTYQNLGKKTFWYFVSKKTGAGASFLVLALILAVVRVSAHVSPQTAGFMQIASRISFAIALLALLIGFIIARFDFKSFAFMLSDDALRIRRGIITQKETAIPYRQIQDIEIERTLSQRTMGLSKVVISTASNDAPDAKGEDAGETVIPAIDEDVALSLQSELLKRANIQKVVQVKK